MPDGCVARVRGRRGGVAALLLGWLAAPGAAFAAADAAPVERWFEMRIAGVPAGYVHESLDRADPDALRTTVDSVIVVNRLDSRVEITEREVTVEDRRGELRSVHDEIRASKETTELDLAIRDGELTYSTRAGGRSYRRVEHDPRPLLGPQAIRALTASRLASGAQTIGYATFLSETGGVAQVTRRLTGHQAGAPGQPPLAVIEETADTLPLPARLVVGADGSVVEEAEPGPLGEVTLAPATAAVRDEVRSGGPLPEELYTHALVRANVRLPEPRAIEVLRVRIDLKRPESGFPELEAPDQHVVERGPDHVVLEVRRAPALEARWRPARERLPFTAPTVILQSDDPDVAALAAQLRRTYLGPLAQARLLQDWVAEHMHFDPGLALLPASEVVRDRRGTCVAYAVLLASLARALGIPARVVMGYVYIDAVWAGHAWTEVRIGKRWIALDAAVYRPGPADAARIALVRHSGERGAASGAAELSRVFGNESIRILGYQIDGRWVDVPQGAAPYLIDGDRYANPWLGLVVDKPADFRFAKADLAYPDSTVIALDAPDGSEIRLLQGGVTAARDEPDALLRAAGYAVDPGRTTVAGRPAVRGARPARAALAFRDGLDLWLLEAEGEAAVRRIDEVAARITLREHAPAAGAPMVTPPP
jgi:transglutaminase-like putative cysteine protease